MRHLLLASVLLASVGLLAACVSPRAAEPTEITEPVTTTETVEPAAAAEPMETLEPVQPIAPVLPTVHLTRFAAGDGPTSSGDGFRLLDAGSNGQSNAVAFDREHEGARESMRLTCRLRVLEGGDGGAIALLNTTEYGVRGAAPFVGSWVEPNLRHSFAVGIDVHNPKNEEPFGPWGNYQGLPEREISLHWDGRELVKRVAPAEFRGDFTDCEVRVDHVVGGAEVTVRMAGAAVYDRFFVPGLLPYESRLAFGAGTRADATTEFDVQDVVLEAGAPAAPLRRAKHVEIFNHVLTDNSKQAFEAEVTLPPASWAFGRIILTLEIHDAGPDWDEWDRNGNIAVFAPDGTKHVIVPFITSYRTPCHWEVDVTHFRPWLSGKTRFEIKAGTKFYKDRGYMMSVSLDFHHGTPALEPYRIDPLWEGVAKYESAENHFKDFFEARNVKLDGQATAARIFTTTTGHSQVGEFTPSKRSITVNGNYRLERYENVLWKTDCYLNPNRPQYGTWKYSRAGWAPGDVVHPWWIDVSEFLGPGGVALEIGYEPEAYDFSQYPPDRRPTQKQVNQASHVVRSYLIAYREPGALMAAPALMVTNVAGNTNASKVGLKAGDYLASYDGRALHSIEDLRAGIQGAQSANKTAIPLVVYRGAERMEFEVGPGKLGVNLATR